MRANRHGPRRIEMPGVGRFLAIPYLLYIKKEEIIFHFEDWKAENISQLHTHNIAVCEDLLHWAPPFLKVCICRERNI